LISGKVQGVFFRATARDVARRLGLSGWVKNLPDGRVEVLCCGEKDKVDRMVEWCRKGPSGAYVTDVEIEWREPTEDFDRFEIRYW
jgi:acylphosphatase